MKKGETFETTISEAFSSIKLNVAYANTTFTVADTDAVSVNYTAGGNGRDITAAVENGEFVIKETNKPFSLGISPSVLNITVPSKEYETVSFSSAAGKTEIGELICKKFDSSIASGQLTCRLFADDVFVKSASGKCEVTNCTDRKANSVIIESASGTHNISGFAAVRYEVVSASGSVNVEGISGLGEIHCASGTIKVGYSEWNGDLEMDVKSGKVEVTLPGSSGAELDMSAMSGSFNTFLEGSASKFTGKCSCTVGGGNVHRVKARLMSGSVTLKN